MVVDGEQDRAGQSCQGCLRGGGIPTGKEWVALALFPIGVVIGMLIGWKSQLIGGCVTAASLVGFYVVMFAMERGSVKGLGPWFAIFSSPGLMILVLGVVERVMGVRR